MLPPSITFSRGKETRFHARGEGGKGKGLVCVKELGSH